MNALVAVLVAGSWTWTAAPVPAVALDPPAVVADHRAAPLALPRQQVLRRASRADPEQEYFVYVPAQGGRDAPLFVAVHGISRNALEHATLLSRYADEYGVVLLAPHFTEERNDDYQRLGRAGRSARRADVVLDDLVAEVASMTGAAADKIYLFGFSGGAQFAHRYAMAHPERVARAVVAAPGWYTFPDETVPYPYGIGASADFQDVRFDPDRFLRVPMAVVVGERDVTNQSLRRNPEVDRQQGVTRLERAKNWVAAMRAAAVARGLEPLVSFESVPDMPHSFAQFVREGGLGERTFLALFGPRQASIPAAAEGSIR